MLDCWTLSAVASAGNEAIYHFGVNGTGSCETILEFFWSCGRIPILHSVSLLAQDVRPSL